jgi:hypothetical protein
MIIEKMPQYKCDLCNYHTEKKQYWYKHKKTKRHIMNLEKKNSTETEQKMSETEQKMSETEQKMSETEQKMSETEQKMSETEQKMSETKRGIQPNNNGLYECNDCNKTFTDKFNFYRHRKHRCIGEENNSCEYCGKIYKKLKFLEKHESKCVKRPQIMNQTIINNTTNNNNINIDNSQKTINYNINIYGQEDISKLITDEVYEKLMLQNPHKALSILMKHFYIDIPEHRNVLYTNISHPHCKIYDGEKWKMENINNVFNERLLCINRNLMKEFNNRELELINTNNQVAKVDDDKEIKIDEIIAGIVGIKDARKEEFEVSKKSKTYRDDLAYTYEQKDLYKDFKNTKTQHCYDLIDTKDELLKVINKNESSI